MKPEKRWITALEDPVKIFLVKDPMLTTTSTTAAYAGKMLQDRAWLHRFTNWVMWIWAAAWQPHESVINLALHSLLSHEASAIFARGRAWLGYMAMVYLVLGWMEQGVWEGLWRDWCYKEGPVTSRVVRHRKDQLPITRSVQVIGQRHGFPVDLPAAVGEALHACLLQTAPAAAQSQPLVSQGVQADINLCVHVGVHLSSEWVYHPHGSPQRVACIMQIIPLPGTWALRALIPERAAYSAEAEQRGHVSALPAKQKSQLNG